MASKHRLAIHMNDSEWKKWLVIVQNYRETGRDDALTHSSAGVKMIEDTYQRMAGQTPIERIEEAILKIAQKIDTSDDQEPNATTSE